MIWTFTEDRLLLVEVQNYGTLKWDQVALSILSHKHSDLACPKRFYELIESVVVDLKLLFLFYFFVKEKAFIKTGFHSS